MLFFLASNQGGLEYLSKKLANICQYLSAAHRVWLFLLLFQGFLFNIDNSYTFIHIFGKYQTDFLANKAKYAYICSWKQWNYMTQAYVPVIEESVHYGHKLNIIAVPQGTFFGR